MGTLGRAGVVTVVGMLMCGVVFGQGKQVKTERRPAADSPAKSERTKPATGDNGYYILDGLPVLLTLYHDTEVGTNKPIDIYAFVIELQVMNSDGDLEPEGLQIFNFYTAHPQDRKGDVNPRNARDCAKWYTLQNKALQERDPKSKTWPYVEFVTATDARVLQTNEHGSVYYSDDIECWGASDRFPPF
ncbi:MAG TPA: hypothetical protein VMJ35_09620 [Dongiaceae bacterium]|nr:hypothetical protein [Dongiaceae bacterium]